FTWWIAEASPATLVPLVPPDPAGRRLLTLEARDLRQALVDLFRAVAEGSASSPPATTTATISRALRASSVTHRLDGLDIETLYDASNPLAMLTPLALSGVAVARKARPERLRPCAAPACRRWFVDTSKSGRRRWCSMERCGNRAKADRYRSRHAESA
ncbi:MAG: CGNR zinc finger domain-containing protein, partial [Gemmatimonadetes bacterium]|nr:CGNR zinc finger domain-containing protein [Gemmatimonadota bacterium]